MALRGWTIPGGKWRIWERLGVKWSDLGTGWSRLGAVWGGPFFAHQSVFIK
jgi:hypothetical protein